MNIEIRKFDVSDMISCMGCGVVSIIIYCCLSAIWNCCWEVPFGASGDGWGLVTLVKYMVDEKNWLHVQGLGAPYGVNLFSQMSLEGVVHWIFLWPLSKITHSIGKTVNCYYILTYGLSAICTFYMLRKVNVSKLCSYVGAIAYAYIPGHISRGTSHIYIGSCYVIPLAILGMVYFLNGDFCKKEFVDKNRLSFKELIKSGNNKLFLSAFYVSLVVFSSLYHGFFAMIVYTFAAIYIFANKRKLRDLFYYCVIAVSAIISVVAECFLPYIFGTNIYSSGLSGRNYGNIELYGLKLTHLILPIRWHRISRLSNITNDYIAKTPLNNENCTSSLGLLMSIGLVIGLYFALILKADKEEELQIYGKMNLFMILVGMIGGIASFVGYITYAFRCFNRMSFWIGGFSVIIVVKLLDCLIARMSHINYLSKIASKLISLVLAMIIVILAVLDQTPRMSMTAEAQERAGLDWGNDDKFVRDVETYGGDNVQVFELPLTGTLPVIVEDYYPMGALYIHSDKSRWSWGASSSSDYEKWRDQLKNCSTEMLIKYASILNFSGIAVYRAIYSEDLWAEMKLEMNRLLGEAVIVHETEKWYYYDLTNYSSMLRSNYSDEEWSYLQDNILNLSPANIFNTYDGTELRVTEGIIDDSTGSVIVYPDAVEYGPYTDLSAGKYYVTYYGEKLQDAFFFCQTGGGTIDIESQEVQRSDSEVTYAIELPEDMDQIEFKCVNSSEKELKISKITCKKEIQDTKLSELILRTFDK